MKSAKITCMTILLAAVSFALILSMASCSNGSSSSSSDSNSDSIATSLVGTWKGSLSGFEYTYVFTETEYTVTVTYNGETKDGEKGTYTIDDRAFTTNETYPNTKTTRWAYTLKTENGKSVFTYDLYYVLTKQ